MCEYTHSGLRLAAVLGLHLGESLVGVLQQLLDVICVLLLQLKLLLFHLRHRSMELPERMNQSYNRAQQKGSSRGKKS